MGRAGTPPPILDSPVADEGLVKGRGILLGRPTMDKLELDARVVRLERRVGLLSPLVLGFLALVGSGLLLALSRRTGARPALQVAVSVLPSIATPAPMPADVVRVGAPAPPGKVADLARHLEELGTITHKATAAWWRRSTSGRIAGRRAGGSRRSSGRA